ncbi:uncharacterized protein PHACADRAFT_181923 [Phanerochaete carnosa HHB-10118-sp]|uniref:Uncharacterized protein n=1 Tax=Phanerochaete carnosa (strain HHB-10118-sp) TaxID=650164 RepID=K5VAW6_PHACS|nr:uncharacterized protein PHACADRAFT_181923 [Phanerochaete carnosa HHB-10118-sp]EKM60016.1 hypothetical protein PHACADRAFT_181923 [Phanerochaete carnosa HHB-10118-sp]
MATVAHTPIHGAAPFVAVEAAAIPHFGRACLAAIWVSAALYGESSSFMMRLDSTNAVQGINCIVFGGALYVLLRRKAPNWQVQPPETYLITWSCLLWLLSTGDEIVAFCQLYRSLTNPTLVGNPRAWDEFWIVPDQWATAHLVIYTTTAFLQDLLLIWRLYIVWRHNWRIVLGPLVIELIKAACAYVACGSLQTDGGFSAKSVRNWGLAGWGVAIFLNTAVTLAITGRLYWAGRKSPSFSDRCTYRATIYTLLESGGMFVAATFTALCLEATGHFPGALGATYCLDQLASIAPLVVIVRIGLGLVHGQNVVTCVTSAPSQSIVIANPMQIRVARVMESDYGEQYSMARLESGNVKSLDDKPLHAVPGPIDN